VNTVHAVQADTMLWAYWFSPKNTFQVSSVVMNELCHDVIPYGHAAHTRTHTVKSLDRHCGPQE